MALATSLNLLIARDLAATRREVEAYPDEALIWAAVPGLPNSGGVLVRHICGNLQHFIGTVLGRTGYRRNRDAEFAGPPDPREWLLQEIDQAARSVGDTLRQVTSEHLRMEYPLPIADHRIETERFLVHLAVHLGFHLGQLDYHRRAVTGQGTSVSPMGVPALV
jgi:hypothetical protein